MIETIVRFECDRCMSHRDVTVSRGDTVADLIDATKTIIYHRAADVGWRIFYKNGVSLCLCERCSKHER